MLKLKAHDTFNFKVPVTQDMEVHFFSIVSNQKINGLPYTVLTIFDTDGNMVKQTIEILT